MRIHYMDAKTKRYTQFNNLKRKAWSITKAVFISGIVYISLVAITV